MEKLKILFIVKSFNRNSPTAIRFRKIIENCYNECEVSVLTLKNISRMEETRNDITIYSIPFSKIGKKFENLINEGRNINSLNVQPFHKIIQRLGSKFRLKRFIFPDVLIFDYINIIRHLDKILSSKRFDIVVGSGGPHTILLIGKHIKTKFPELKWVYDVSDPFYGNTLYKSKLKQFLARMYDDRYLKYIDLLVVTNTITKNHYLAHFSKYINNSNIITVSHGTDLIAFDTKDNVNIGEISKIHMIYAGTFYDKIREPSNLYNALTFFTQSKLSLCIYGNIAERHLPGKMHLKNGIIKYKGVITYEELKNKYLESNVIIFIDNSCGLQTPGKIFEVLSFGKTVLFIYQDEKSPSIEIMKAYPATIFAKNSIREITIALKNLLNNGVKNVDNFDMSEFSWSNRAKEYISALSVLVEG